MSLSNPSASVFGPCTTSITPSSYTWEVAVNSEHISAQEQLQLFPPMHYCVFIFCEFHLPSYCPIIQFIKSFGMFSQSSILSCLVSPPHYSINLLDHYGVYWKVYSPNYKVIILEIGFCCDTFSGAKNTTTKALDKEKYSNICPQRKWELKGLPMLTRDTILCCSRPNNTFCGLWYANKTAGT